MPPSASFEERCVQLVERLKLAAPGDVRSVKTLAGGVSSDIAAVDVGKRRYCVKFALEKLRVAEDWHAPVDRNLAEYEWLSFANDAVPGVAPKLYGRDAGLNGFAMEFIAGDDIYLWKAALLEGKALAGEAALVGDALGRIHKSSTDPGFDASAFQNQQDFFDLRLDPYLAFTASVHPELAASLQGLIDSLQNHTLTLIHGDVSPKNIIFRNSMPVLLDAECATMGDPAFDVAFLLNHLLLKACHMAERAEELIGELSAFWSSYARHCCWEDPEPFELRIGALLPALMLARIDGKSPVEYLNEQTRKRVRAFSHSRVLSPPGTLGDLANDVLRMTKNSN